MIRGRSSFYILFCIYEYIKWQAKITLMFESYALNVMLDQFMEWALNVTFIYGSMP